MTCFRILHPMVQHSENEVSKTNFIYILTCFFFFFFTTSRAVAIIFTKLKLVSGVVNIFLFSQSTKPGLKQGKFPVPGPY